jgi:hypothetical protein
MLINLVLRLFKERINMLNDDSKGAAPKIVTNTHIVKFARGTIHTFADKSVEIKPEPCFSVIINLLHQYIKVKKSKIY